MHIVIHVVFPEKTFLISTAPQPISHADDSDSETIRSMCEKCKCYIRTCDTRVSGRERGGEGSMEDINRDMRDNGA